MDGALHPRLNHKLIGHSDAIALLNREIAHDTLAGSWIFAGPEGVGKATLAYHLARSLFSGAPIGEIDFSHPISQRVEAESHADLLAVQPLFDEKKGAYVHDITVDQVRHIPQFLSLTAGESEWRVVIIDTIDVLNVNAANAILKTLEEPPSQSIIILISHNPDLLLPTIRSRCRSIRLTPLNEDDFNNVLRHISDDINDDELPALSALSYQSAGVALTLHEENAVSLYEDIVALMGQFPDIDASELHRFAEGYGGAKNVKNWDILTKLLLIFLQRASLFSSGYSLIFICDEEEQVLRQLSQMHNGAVWAQKYQQTIQHFITVERLHFDCKQVIIAFISSLATAEGMQFGTQTV